MSRRHLHRTLYRLAESNRTKPRHPDRVCPLTNDRVTEAELIVRVIAGDRVAARQLYDAHAPRVFSLAFRLTGDPELAKEFAQETFIRAFNQLSKFRGDSALSTWIYRITVTVTANAMRKVKRFREREGDLDEATALAIRVPAITSAPPFGAPICPTRSWRPPFGGWGGTSLRHRTRRSSVKSIRSLRGSGREKRCSPPSPRAEAQTIPAGSLP